MEEARQLFRDKERTEFIIVSIPTVMAVAESERLAASLKAEQVPVKRILMNQLVCAFSAFLKSWRHLGCSFACIVTEFPHALLSDGVCFFVHVSFCTIVDEHEVLGCRA
jgi:anion-transporting  ArsA/GET3 family ATPase